jgi:hypothetical protein
MAARGQIKGCLAFQHGVDGPSEPVGQPGAGFALAMLMLPTRQGFVRRWILAQAQRSRFGKGPLEVGVPAVLARSAQAFPRGLLRPVAQATIRAHILDPWAAVNGMEVIEQHAAEPLATPGHGWPQLEGVGVMVFGGLDEGQLQSGKQLVVVGDQRQVDRNASLHGGIGKALGHPLPVRFVGDLLVEVRQVVLTVRVLTMGSEFRALAQQMGAASSEVAGRAPPRGIDVGLRQHAPAAQDGHRV